MDLARTRAALLGCLGVTVIAFIFLYTTLQRMRRSLVKRERVVAELPVACIPDPERIRPIIVGDSARLTIGTSDGRQCTTREQTGFQWRLGGDTAIAQVRQNGVAIGRSPGYFTMVAQRGDSSLETFGFVMPPEWQAKISPENIKLRVGDSVAIVMRAVDKAGGPLPVVPFSIFTPEFFEPEARRKPILNSSAWQDATKPVFVTATDTGSSVLIGRIGVQQVTAHVTVTPRK